MGQWNTPADLKYARTDEWLRLEGDTGTIGLTDYAQDALNDLVFVELPEVGAKLAKGATLGTVESVKAASDMVMPVSGVVTEVNSALEDEPEQINASPYEAWIIKIRLDGAADTSDLLDADAYAAYCAEREH
jgi:glycine cleavage system H protein